jgi:hypothetical protein
MTVEPTPSWDSDGVPECLHETRQCRNFDGKRCDILGERPDWICRPMVRRMAELLRGQDKLSELMAE